MRETYGYTGKTAAPTQPGPTPNWWLRIVNTEGVRAMNFFTDDGLAYATANQFIAQRSWLLIQVFHGDKLMAEYA